MLPSDIQNKKVTILGSERSGMGAAKLLHQFGAQILVSEKDALKFTAEKRELLASMNAKFEFGYHSDDVLDADFVVVSPGIPENAEIMIKIREKGLPLYSEVEMASWFITEPIIAVTGSNGKTTTVNLIHHLLRECGIPSFLGGNVGQAISEVILERQAQEEITFAVFILEVSSFQLDHIDTFHPRVALILNLSPDHLDRYATVEDYYNSKLKIWKNSTSLDIIGYNADDPLLVIAQKPKATHYSFGLNARPDLLATVKNHQLGFLSNDVFESVIAENELPIPGAHNTSNALAAILAISPFIDDPAAIGSALKSFQPVPHRIEFVATVKGMRFYNDSKATNVASTAVAIQSFNAPEWVILGGKDKGGEFYTLAVDLAQRARKVLLVGQATDIIADQLAGTVAMESVETIERAIDYALENGESGDVVLLSPGCASYDQFDNYEHRGNFFKSTVLNRKEKFGE